MKLHYETRSITHIGLVRKNNQDAISINKDVHMFCVADGLGGHLGGEVASSLALDTFLEGIKKSMKDPAPTNLSLALRKAYHSTNHEVYSQSQKHVDLKGMGTTLVVMCIENDQMFIGNVGDSRAYLCRGGQLWQLTDDHTLGALNVKNGFEMQGQSEKQKGSNVLTQSVGFTNSVNPDIINIKIQEGDIYLLCSDGLHGMVSDSEILDVLNKENFKDVAQKCVIKALSAGGFDNISVVAVKILSSHFNENKK